MADDDVIFSQADLAAWRIELARARDVFLRAQREFHALERKVKAAEYLMERRDV